MDNKTEEEAAQEEIARCKLPRTGEIIGICEQRVGGSRMQVRCMDSRSRNCRIPGRLKRKLWVREGDILLIAPWKLGGDDKGDVIFKYRPLQVKFLRDKGYLKGLDEFGSF